jgi:tyrosyl-tRNA synthetase
LHGKGGSRLSAASKPDEFYSIKSRLESESGISFTEFTYHLLQAYDFWHLRQRYNCSIQLGGSDQYGNIMAGIEMVQKEAARSAEKRPKGTSSAFGVTLPLLTAASGAKFGKSANNAVWLDPSMTAPLDLYQVGSFHSRGTPSYVTHSSSSTSAMKTCRNISRSSPSCHWTS